MADILNRIHIGDALTVLKTFPDEFVHCVVTSPPYYGLRNYQVDGQLGLERTHLEYVDKLVEVFREVRRVLRSDGTAWINLGDSYASGKGTCYNPGGNTSSFNVRLKEQNVHPLDRGNKSSLETVGLKPKDLMMIPARVAMALQADGWYLRSDIIWSKPNPMPESVTDRPTKAHEYIFLLSKSAKYDFDQDAVREDGPTYHRKAGGYDKPELQGCYDGRRGLGFATKDITTVGRNIRTVWTIATQPYREAHFATFPEEIPERCIKAGTSEKGCCPTCGGPWVRVVSEATGGTKGKSWHDHSADAIKGNLKTGSSKGYNIGSTIGWQPPCSCGEQPVPCIVLDPFIGSGTVAKVAIRLRRNWIGIDLNEKYFELAEKRKAWTQVEMI